MAHDFRAHDIDAPVSLPRSHLVPVVANADGRNKTRGTPATVVMAGLAVHRLRFGKLRGPLRRVVFPAFALEGMETPDQHAQARVHRAVGLRPLIDHRLHIGSGGLGSSRTYFCGSPSAFGAPGVGRRDL